MPRYMYNSTAIWRGGVGGRMMTEGVCDKCWGTGRSDKRGTDLKKMEQFDRQYKEKSVETVEDALRVIGVEVSK